MWWLSSRTMARSPRELRRALGAAARLWAAPEHLDAGEDWWIACSGQLNVNYNVAFCQSSDPTVLIGRCLKPVLDLGRPAIIMLAGAGLATAQRLAESGWVAVGALPLMSLTAPIGPEGDRSGVRALGQDDLPSARALLADAYGLDDGSATAAIPGRAVDAEDMGIWGVFDGEELASCFTGVVEDGLFVVWSMATSRQCEGLGYGRRLLRTVLGQQFEQGLAGSLLQSSIVGKKLYLGLGYSVVEHWQLWSRPRWIMANA